MASFWAMNADILMHFFQPAGNVSLILSGSLLITNPGTYLDRKVAQLYFWKTLPIKYCHLSFKRILRTIILFCFCILPKVFSFKSIPFHEWVCESSVCVTLTQTMTHFPIIVKKVVFKLPPQKSNFMGNTVSSGLAQQAFPQCWCCHNYRACMCL